MNNCISKQPVKQLKSSSMSREKRRGVMWDDDGYCPFNNDANNIELLNYKSKTLPIYRTTITSKPEETTFLEEERIMIPTKTLSSRRRRCCCCFTRNCCRSWRWIIAFAVVTIVCASITVPVSLLVNKYIKRKDDSVKATTATFVNESIIKQEYNVTCDNIKNISKNLNSHCEYLVSLNCLNNYNRNRDEILSILKTIENIKILDLNDNNLKFFTASDYLNATIQNVDTLLLNYNNLSMITKEMFAKVPSSLKVLEMRYNQLNRIERQSFHFTVNLESLDLSYNNLESLHPNIFPKKMVLRDNEQKQLKKSEARKIFDSLKTESFTSTISNKSKKFENTLTLPLKRLSVNNNRLTDLDFIIHLKDLIILNVNFNNITKAYEPFKIMSLLAYGDDVDIEQLFIAHNQLESLDFVNLLPKLHTLKVNHNHIEVIATYQFSRSKMLKTLDLSYNKLKVIHANAFEGPSNLRSLNLKSNDLHIIRLATVELPSIELIVLANNTNLIEINDSLLKRNVVIFLDKYKIRCMFYTYLANMQRKKLLNAKLKYIVNEHEHDLYSQNKNTILCRDSNSTLFEVYKNYTVNYVPTTSKTHDGGSEKLINATETNARNGSNNTEFTIETNTTNTTDKTNHTEFKQNTNDSKSIKMLTNDSIESTTTITTSTTTASTTKTTTVTDKYAKIENVTFKELNLNDTKSSSSSSSSLAFNNLTTTTTTATDTVTIPTTIITEILNDTSILLLTTTPRNIVNEAITITSVTNTSQHPLNYTDGLTLKDNLTLKVNNSSNITTTSTTTPQPQNNKTNSSTLEMLNSGSRITETMDTFTTILEYTSTTNTPQFILNKNDTILKSNTSKITTTTTPTTINSIRPLNDSDVSAQINQTLSFDNKDEGSNPGLKLNDKLLNSKVLSDLNLNGNVTLNNNSSVKLDNLNVNSNSNSSAKLDNNVSSLKLEENSDKITNLSSIIKTDDNNTTITTTVVNVPDNNITTTEEILDTTTIVYDSYTNNNGNGTTNI